MSLTKETTLTIKNNVGVKLSSPLKFFKNDTLILYFIVEQYNFDVKSYETLVPLNAILHIENPEGEVTAEPVELEDNKITFKLTQKYTQHVGVFKLQFVIRDAKTENGVCCQCAIPPFEMEVQEVIDGTDYLKDKLGDTIVTKDGDVLELKNLNEIDVSDVYGEIDSLEDTSVLVQKDGQIYTTSTDNLIKLMNVTREEYDAMEKNTATMYIIIDENKIYLGEYQLGTFTQE